MSHNFPAEPPEADRRRSVFVIHGRDDAAKTALFSFLRDLDLRPLEWEELVKATGSVNPFTGEVVAHAFKVAQAVVVLFTPDDEARLHEELRGPTEPDYEVMLTGQPRPNVLLEAGMALGHQPNRTIFVELGHLRPMSDLAGRNVIRLNGSPARLNDLVGRLEFTGCQVSRASSRWLDGGRFSNLAALERGSTKPTSSDVEGDAAAPSLGIRLSPQGSDDYIFEVTNRGNGKLKEVSWSIPDSASNWRLSNKALDEYPIPEIQPNEIVRVPAIISLGGPSMIIIELSAKGAGGQNYNVRKRLSIFDSGGSEWI
jgi:Predicted nucleotide-binding protein containing TIR-like domain